MINPLEANRAFHQANAHALHLAIYNAANRGEPNVHFLTNDRDYILTLLLKEDYRFSMYRTNDGYDFFIMWGDDAFTPLPPEPIPPKDE